MKPAYYIPLSKRELADLGRICAIQGQIDFLMQDTLMHLLHIDRPEAQAILGSTLGPNTEIWIKIVRRKCRHPRLTELADKTEALISKSLAGNRNDFIHAIFAEDVSGGFGFSTHAPKIPVAATAARTRNLKKSAPSKIKETRNVAAKVSRMIAHMNHEMSRAAGHVGGRSPFRGKF